MKNILIALMIMLLNKPSIANTAISNDMLLNIQFQDFFVNDKIDLKINDVPIFKDVIVNSDRSTGFTGITIVINKLDNDLMQIHYCSLNINTKLRDKIKIDIFLNGVENVFVVDGSKGKYIGFSKKDGNQFYFRQRAKQFVYD